MSFDDVLSGTQQELRRGTVVLACLLLLRRPGYGYALLEDFAGSWASRSTRTPSTRSSGAWRAGDARQRVEHTGGEAPEVLPDQP